MNAYLLDTGILGKVCHPKPGENQEVARVIRRLAMGEGGDVRMVVPEIADYELRRELLRIGSTVSLKRLDQLAEDFDYLPIRTRTMKRAAELWAELRNKGLPTAPREALDGDAILAAQAEEVEGTVITDNVGHLSRFRIQVKSIQDLNL